MRFHKIADGLDVSEIVRQLDDHPELWGAHLKFRNDLNGPFSHTKDIWVRFRDPCEVTGPESCADQYHSVWYPAWYALPALKPLIFSLMSMVEAVQLCDILITKIPAGKNVGNHRHGSWHAHFTDCKAFVPLSGGNNCIFRSEEESAEFYPGEVWVFDNLLDHSVENVGDEDQITMVVCMRSESGNYLNMK